MRFNTKREAKSFHAPLSSAFTTVPFATRDLSQESAALSEPNTPGSAARLRSGQSRPGPGPHAVRSAPYGHFRARTVPQLHEATRPAMRTVPKLDRPKSGRSPQLLRVTDTPCDARPFTMT